MLNFADGLFRKAIGPVAAVSQLELNALQFPQNGDDPSTTLVAFQFTGANLLPAYPATYIWRFQPTQQTGFYATFFYGQIDGNFGGAGYYGCHPFPQGGSSGTVHNWEISIAGTDYITDDNANSTVVTKGQWYTQALVVRLVNTDEIEAKFYWDLETAETRVITFTSESTENYADTFPPTSPGLTWGAAPWEPGTERLSTLLGALKIFDTNLSEAEVISEAADMTDIVTATGIANRWWFKATYTDVDDLTDSVTDVAAAWATASKATLVAI